MKMITNLPIHSLHLFHLLCRMAMAKTIDDTVEMEREWSKTESNCARVILNKYLQQSILEIVN